MTNGTSEPAAFTIDDYPRMQTGGWIAVVTGLGGLVVLLTAGFTTTVVLPTGTAALTMGAFLAGTILLSLRLVLRKLDEHRAEHATGTLSVDDVHRIEHHLANLGAQVAALSSQVAGLRTMVAHCDMVADPVKFEAAAAKAASAAAVDVARASWAAGAVDVLDGRASVIPINQANGFRMAPRDQPHQA